MLTIIHAADFHLDSPFAALTEEQAVLRRREQRALLRELADAAQGADLVLLSGDLLDSERCHGETAEALEEFLNALPGHVFIAPGNHDYYAPLSPYFRMRLKENIHIFTDSVLEAVPLPDKGVTVWGAAFTSPRSRGLLRGFIAPGDGNTHIMVLHGDADPVTGEYGPIAGSEIASSGLRYLALGHIHSYSGLKRSGSTYWAYPGCLMGRGFDETGPKGFLRVTLDGERCTAQFVPLSGRQYHILPVDVTDAADIPSAVRAALPENAKEHIFRILLRGEWPEKPDPEALREALKPYCHQLEIRDGTRIQRDIWDAVSEDSLRGCFLRVLKEKYNEAPEEERAKLMLAARFGLAALDYREDL